MRVLPVVVVAALAATAAALAVPAGSRTFAEKGFEVTFRYPASFQLAKSVTLDKKTGASAAARRALALDAVNAIIVTRFNLRVAITRANVKHYRHEVDGVFGKLAGKPVRGRLVVFGGLPGYEYRIGLTNPAQGRSRLDVLFLRKSEYLLNCQSTPKRRADIERGCAQMLATLRPKR